MRGSKIRLTLDILMNYLIIVLVLIALELLYFKVADHYNIIDKPNERSSHTRITLRGGGVLFYLGVVLHALFFGLMYPWFLLGLTLIATISFVDDVRSVPNRLRLAIHFTAMLLLFYEWGLFDNANVLYLLIALILCTGIINAYNFMDGINGITGGMSAVILFGLIYANYEVTPYIETSFLYVSFFAVMVFNFFNFRTKAKCFAGDVGSVSIAFILIFALGKLILATNDWTYIIFLAVYGVDSVLTIIHRLLLHENIFKAHRRHAYQLLANEWKVPHVVVSTGYALLQAGIIVGYFLLQEQHLLYTVAVIGVLSMLYVGFYLYNTLNKERR